MLNRTEAKPKETKVSSTPSILKDSISPLIRRAADADLTRRQWIVWRNFNGEYRDRDRPFHWVLAKPLVVRTVRDTAEAIAPWHHSMPVPKVTGVTINADLTLSCLGRGNNRSRLIERMGDGESPEEQLRMWFERWLNETIDRRGIRGLVGEFPNGRASREFFEEFGWRLEADCGLSAKGALSLVGAQSLATAPTIRWSFQCNVRECAIPVTFKIGVGLKPKPGRKAIPLGGTGALDEYRGPIEETAKAYLRDETPLSDLGGATFSERESIIRGLIDAAILADHGLTTAWFTLAPVFLDEIDVTNTEGGKEEWFTTSNHAGASISYRVTAALVAKGRGPSHDTKASSQVPPSDIGPGSDWDPAREIQRLITEGLSAVLRKMSHKEICLAWDRPGDSGAVKDRLTECVRARVSSSGFASLRSVRVELLHAEWVEVFRRNVGVPSEPNNVAVLPGNVPIDLKYSFRYRVIDVDENATEGMSLKGFPSADLIKNEVEAKFKSVLFKKTSQTKDEPLSAGLKLEEINSRVNAELVHPGLGLVIRIEDLLRFPTQVELYRCQKMIDGLTAQIDVEVGIVNEYRNQRLQLEKERAQLIAAGLGRTDARTNKNEALEDIKQELKEAEGSLSKSQQELAKVQTHMSLLQEANENRAGIDGTRPIQYPKDEGDIIEAETTD
jgi:hypothetical protein